MLAKKYRLNLSLKTDNQGFNFHSSKRFFSDNFIIYFQQNDSLKLRVAALAPKRLFPKASRRNYCRRLIYNLLEEKAQELNKSAKVNLFKENLDLVVVFKQKDFVLEQLKEDLNLFLKNNLQAKL